MVVQRELTRHAMALGRWKGCHIHVGNSSWCEVVERLLNGEVEEPVRISRQVGISVERSGRIVHFRDKFWISGLVNRHSLLASQQDADDLSSAPNHRVRCTVVPKSWFFVQGRV